ncbi:MAG TPA: AAA family ATPase [Tissierellia bacterium]|nr:AAA family ATPase [Tissierellia bacterium]
MLLELNLRNFILIEDIRLAFGEGLNIVTGETGAGKSIILEGLRICLGNRTSKDYLRNPDQKATFEMIYSTPEELFAITREIFPSGRAISRLNGDIVNVDTIERTIGPYLDIYGQRDHFYLLDPNHQQSVIDSFDPMTVTLQAEIAQTVTAYRETEAAMKELISLASSDVETEKTILQELHGLAIDVEADREKEALFARLTHMADIVSGLSEASDTLDASVLDSLERVIRTIALLEDYDPTYHELSSRLESVRLELEDIGMTLRERRRSLDLDESELKALNDRISALHSARRTYQRDLTELVAYQEELRERIAAFDSLAEKRQALEDRSAQLLSLYDDQSHRLRDHRARVFKQLKGGLIESLSRMELPDVALSLEQTPRPGEPRLSGRYQAEILASMNGRDLRPMKDVLSGGEMSRFILALKQVFSQREKTLTMVFDEIDAGISGQTAFEVGRNIKRLSQEKQVIAITHLPQLTAFADVHYQISKADATTLVKRLDASEHTERLALMMSSALSESSIASAKELIERAKQSLNP